MKVTENNRHLLVLFVGVLTVYLLTMPLTITLEDDGFFVMSSYFNGVSHPPGYPLHSFLGKLFTLIPIGSIAARVHALSAVFAALTCVCLWKVIYLFLHRYRYAYAGALIYAFSLTFWSQAIIAEVYTLNTFLFFLLFYLVLKISDLQKNNDDGKRIESIFYLSAFVYGLSLTNHWPLMVLSSPVLLIIIWPLIKEKPALLAKALIPVSIGLLPYVWMVINSNSDVEISFTGAINSWQELINFIARTRYAEIDNSASATAVDKIQYAGFFFNELMKQFSAFGFVLLILGLFAQFKYIEARVSLALIVGFLTNSLLLILLLNFEYIALYQYAISVYFLISYGIASIWLVFGLVFVFDKMTEKWKFKYKIQPFHAGILIVLISSVFVNNLSRNYRHNYDWGIVYAKNVLDLMPEKAVLILNDDVSVGTVGYLHYVENYRPDVTVLNDKGVIFKNRLFDPETIKANEIDKIIEDYIKSSEYPVFSTAYTKNRYNQDFWLVRGASNDASTGAYYLHASAIKKEYIEYILKQKNNNDAWTKMHRSILLENFAPFLVELLKQNKNDKTLNYALAEIISTVGGFAMFYAYIQSSNRIDEFGGLNALLSMANKLNIKTADKKTKAEYQLLLGHIEQKMLNDEVFADHMRQSIVLWPNKNNRAISELHRYYLSTGRNVAANKLLKKYPLESVYVNE